MTLEAKEAFERIKNMISSDSNLLTPDLYKESIFATDASNEAIGAKLSQICKDGKERAVCYFSKDEPQFNFTPLQRI